jgi:hypothetical protein
MHVACVFIDRDVLLCMNAVATNYVQYVPTQASHSPRKCSNAGMLLRASLKFNITGEGYSIAYIYIAKM